MFKTRITELFGIKYPIIQGALGWGLSGAELVSAVANAGGLGIMAALSYPTPKELREEIRKAKSMTDKPFAVNIALGPTVQQVKREDYIAAAIEEGIGIIETAARSPEPYMKMFKDAQVKVMHKVGSIKHAKAAERIGVDAVSIVGIEAAGHPVPDDVAGSILIPACVDAVKIPVIAAGGIADARGFVSALALGAEGVLMGTRFFASKECPAHPKIKERLLELGETDTMIINRSINNMQRVIKTDLARKVLELEEKGATLEEILPLIRGEKSRNASEKGDVNNAVITAGQVAGLIHNIPSVKEIIESIINEAKVIVQRLNNQIASD